MVRGSEAAGVPPGHRPRRVDDDAASSSEGVASEGVSSSSAGVASESEGVASLMMNICKRLSETKWLWK